ncbi:hypothetical protein LUZ62_022823 [Rhynchospora pubera]|uniref:Uncharacterized protein n=1 Tax=Rhynchospora pubera TaxID=906938 RepID=A0AAV8CS01_9POAL|nr:hypothetical protein LUZ62_068163 [Rhynchospora pubera]KAJ4810257.1 hypothetical protein LUZ62_022823 [Rhynchospora pubera]
MDRRCPKSAPSSPTDDRFLRFLKPGALARIRDSKIIARSVRSVPLSRLAPPSSPSPDEQSVAPETTGRQPRFVFYRVSGPRYPSRKKLVASRSVYFAPPSPDFSDPFGDVGFGSDLLVAH